MGLRVTNKFQWFRNGYRQVVVTRLKCLLPSVQVQGKSRDSKIVVVVVFNLEPYFIEHLAIEICEGLMSMHERDLASERPVIGVAACSIGMQPI